MQAKKPPSLLGKRTKIPLFVTESMAIAASGNTQSLPIQFVCFEQLAKSIAVIAANKKVLIVVCLLERYTEKV